MLKLLSISYFLLQIIQKEIERLRNYLNPIKLISSDPQCKDDNSQRYP